MKFYECGICGNIIQYAKESGIPVRCCGQKMNELIPGTSDGAAEKHIPAVKVEGDRVFVQIGSVEHPMTREHYIEWICLETEHGIQYAHLDPDDKPKAKFAIVRITNHRCHGMNTWSSRN